MRFYTHQHKHYGGIDLHARSLYVGILDQAGTVLVHKNVAATPEACLRLSAPYREDLVVAVEGIFTWYWLADLWAQEGMAFILGPALSRKAMHGGKAQNDKIDSHKIAVLLRGGRIPMADGYPPALRATRDLLRRRCHLRRNRAELLAHMQNTNSQYHLPDFGTKLAYKGNRDGGEEHFPEPSLRKTIARDVALIAPYDQLWGEVELSIPRTAKGHNAQHWSRRQSVPGMGKILALVLLYEIQDSARFPRVPDFVSYGRRVKGAKASAGKRLGPSGKKIGTPQLTGAFSAAAVLLLRQHQPGKEDCATVERNHGKGTALTGLAPKLARAGYYI